MSSYQPDFQAFSICMIVFPLITVVLRLWSRYLQKTGDGPWMWWDDYLALVALPVSIAASALHIYLSSLGLGQHVADLSKDDVTHILKVLWASYFLSDLGIALPKASVLFFYARVFTTHRPWFRYALWVGHALNFLWWVEASSLCLLFCDPVYKYWDGDAPGFCRSGDSLFIGSAVPSVAIDLYVLLLPLPLISRLSLKTSRKILVTGVFVCGYLVIAISLGRLVTSLTSGEKLDEDLTFNVIPIMFWVDAEPPVSIIGCSLPTLFHLMRTGMRHSRSAVTSYSGWSSKQRNGLGTAGRRNRSHSGADSLELGGGALEHGSTADLYAGPGGRHDAKATRSSSKSGFDDSGDGRMQPGIVVHSGFQVRSDGRP